MTILKMLEFLRENDILSKKGSYIVDHFSHNVNNEEKGGRLMMLHSNLQHLYGKHGIEVAYDGMIIDNNTSNSLIIFGFMVNKYF